VTRTNVHLGKETERKNRLEGNAYVGAGTICMSKNLHIGISESK
jgi:hypothetical protein